MGPRELKRSNSDIIPSRKEENKVALNIEITDS